MNIIDWGDGTSVLVVAHTLGDAGGEPVIVDVAVGYEPDGVPPTNSSRGQFIHKGRRPSVRLAVVSALNAVGRRGANWTTIHIRGAERTGRIFLRRGPTEALIVDATVEALKG